MGPIDILVNIVGWAGDDPFVSLDYTQIRNLVDVNEGRCSESVSDQIAGARADQKKATPRVVYGIIRARTPTVPCATPGQERPQRLLGPNKGGQR
ncbi:hypothetical protein [Rhodococcus sp. LB1]|uniref:hypothetical protein n=1 Tax=Rhodococcus sp. LB1 TaxID=1807499 RepID=UPI000A994C8D|nr:hypothetical protein [Rhodococcus sp. LB1]